MTTCHTTEFMINHLAPRKLLRAGIPFFVAGALVVTGFNGTSPLIAGETPVKELNQAIEASLIPTSFAELADKLSPGVVNVKVTTVVQAGFQAPGMNGNPFDDFFGQFFNQMPRGQGIPPARGAGSGVIISEDGYILSNSHVVEGAKEVSVTLSNKKEYPAALAATPVGEKVGLTVLRDGKEKQLNDSKNKDTLLLLVQRQNGTFYVPLEAQG